MHKGRFPTVSHCILVAVILLCGAAGLLAADQIVRVNKHNPADKGRVDLIFIDALSAFGPLERPPVVFLHDKHTQAMEKQKQDCRACHTETNGKLSPKFKRTEDQSRQQVMTIYHDNCIGCHTDSAAKGIDSGPVTCGECHRKQNDLVSTSKPMGLDKSLHYRHVLAQEKKCESCHHEYNPKTKKLFYEKGKEGSCAYCHKAETEENRISGRLAAHQQCITCHREKKAQNINAGPIYCQGCHDEKAQQKIEKVTEIPRMELNQPDAVLIRAADTVDKADTAEVPPEGIAPVAFNHKAHESYSTSCRSCHHASMAACTSCHTPGGHKDGQNVRLSTAMHKRDATASCIGCHATRQASPQCAGCHSSIKVKDAPDASTCQACHLEGISAAREPMDKEAAEVLAKELIASRDTTTKIYSMADIPEKVLIKKLVDQYQPVELPHRKIITKLVENIKGDKIAAHYHQDPGTLCQGCHHNSPPSKTPPSCSNCHGEPFDTGSTMRPGLLGAYHQQCFQCHAEMGIEKPDSRDCTTCHPKKEGAPS